MKIEKDVQVLLQSDVFGQELFSYSDDEQAFAAMRRILAESRSAFRNDGIDRVIGIILSNRQD